MVSNIKWNVVIFVTNNVVHMWLDNTWHFMPFDLQLYIIVANVHVLMDNQCMQHVMVT
jgi:short subunit fatty acids transporter